MSGGARGADGRNPDTGLNLTHLRAYGDAMNDGMVQVSFSLPIPHDERGAEAARTLARKMGLTEPNVAWAQALDDAFTFYVVYGACAHSVDYTNVHARAAAYAAMDMHQVDEYIREHFGRRIVVVGASTGTDAHTVGIDAIMNRKGFAGHYGLERYEMIEAHNLGAQVPNEAFVRRAVDAGADVLLVSQTVTQRDAHIHNLTELIELLEAEGVRGRFVVICGGARITHELAKELGYDAGFGPGKFAEDVATFAVEEMARRRANR